jgi:hypothetical protein
MMDFMISHRGSYKYEAYYIYEDDMELKIKKDIPNDMIASYYKKFANYMIKQTW